MSPSPPPLHADNSIKIISYKITRVSRILWKTIKGTLPLYRGNSRVGLPLVGSCTEEELTGGHRVGICQ